MTCYHAPLMRMAGKEVPFDILTYLTLFSKRVRILNKVNYRSG